RIQGDRKWGLTLQEKNDDGKWVAPHEMLVVNSLIIPAPHKVHLPSNFARNTCECITLAYKDMLNEMENEHGKEAISSYRNKLTYEVTLSEISDIRQSLFSQRFIDK
ncbi:hypothetical protein, partial [Vibrio anguillarum]|uniref:hypothetical protein n=1 Tax=Vibrio anguillarum TaxID=55601 RepID=UPI001BE4C2F4